MLAKVKPDPPFDFQAEKSAWLAGKSERDGKVAKLDAMTMALTMAGESQEAAARLTPVGEHLAARRKAAAEFLDVARRKPHKLKNQISDLKDDLSDSEPAFHEAARRWEHVKSVETSRVAISLQPRQREVAKRISRALGELSTALFESDELNQQLAASAPNATSLYLPNLASDFGDMRLGNPFSAASRWLKRRQTIGVL